MEKEFSVGFRTTAEEMDAMLPLSMSAEGIGAATYLIAFLAGSRAGGLTGLVLVALGVAALFAHLGHPLRAWRVISGAGRAWMSRGAVFTGGLVVLGAPALLFQAETLPLVILQALTLLCTVVVVLYAGILFSSITAVPFWNSPLLPVLLLLQSLASAALLLTAMVSLGGGGIAPHARECGAVLALLASALALTWMFARATPRSEAAQESVRLLTVGSLQPVFQGGAVLAGLVAPLLLVLLAYAFRRADAVPELLLGLAVLLRLTGDASLRYALLRAGVYAPVI